MTDSPLFRPAALDAQRVQWHGDIVMSQPLSYRFLALLAALLAGSLIAFAVFGSYTKRTTVIGQVAPNIGLAKLYVQQTGIVIEERVKEGQHVLRGDVLFVLSSDRQSSTLGETQAAISDQTKLRQQTLLQELRKTEELALLDRESLEKKISGLRLELPRLESQLKSQRARTELAELSANQYRELNKQGYVSRDQAIARDADLLDQRTRLDSVERDQIATQRNLDDALSQLRSLPLKYENQIAEIKRNISSAQQDLTESEARRESVVIATESGTATALTAHVGQAVDSNKPIVSIVPDGAVLQAELYAPSRAVGFVKQGDAVQIRYQAFPYQKFGEYSGTVTSIATTALSSAELTGTNIFASGGPQGGEPLYRISVRLASDAVTAYGKQVPLQAGMMLDADILQETRRLYEWILEPLYSISGKL